MDWLALVVAGLFEIVWAVGLKYTQSFTKLWPSIYTLAAMVVSFLLLSFSLRSIPMGTAYAVWTGIGAAGTLLFGIMFLGESRDPIRISAILGIIGCILVLKMTHK